VIGCVFVKLAAVSVSDSPPSCHFWKFCSPKVLDSTKYTNIWINISSNWCQSWL